MLVGQLPIPLLDIAADAYDSAIPPVPSDVATATRRHVACVSAAANGQKRGFHPTLASRQYPKFPRMRERRRRPSAHASGTADVRAPRCKRYR